MTAIVSFLRSRLNAVVVAGLVAQAIAIGAGSMDLKDAQTQATLAGNVTALLLRIGDHGDKRKARGS